MVGVKVTGVVGASCKCGGMRATSVVGVRVASVVITARFRVRLGFLCGGDELRLRYGRELRVC